MSEQQEKKGKGCSGCLIAFLITLGVVGFIIIGGYFYITTIYLPQKAKELLTQPETIGQIKQSLKEANITLNNEDIDELIDVTNKVKSGNITRVLNKLDEKGNAITSEDLIEIVNTEFELETLTVVKNNGGWESVKRKFRNEVNDRQVQAMVAELKENSALKQSLPRMTVTVKKTLVSILEEMKE